MDSYNFLNITVNYCYKNKLAEILLPIAKKYLNDKTHLTNFWNYKNTYTDGPGLSLYPDLFFFKKILLEIADEYFLNNGIKIKDEFELSVSLFASEMVLGNEHNMHDHPGALLSGLIYLQVPVGSANLEIYNPKSSNKAWRLALDNSCYVTNNELFTIDETQKIIIKPQVGLLVFWESWIKHCVPVNQSIDSRITMVFNIGIKNKNEK